MLVRLAKLTDLSDIVAFGKDAMEKSNYAPLPYNAVIARRTAKAAMTSKDSRVWVAEDKGRIVGLLIGEIGPMPWTHYFGATDLVFIADAAGDMLLDAMLEWCKLRGVARIDMGVSAGPDREDAVRRLFERKGFKYSGPMFHMNMELPGESK